jgi:hypothetical protein
MIILEGIDPIPMKKCPIDINHFRSIRSIRSIRNYSILIILLLNACSPGHQNDTFTISGNIPALSGHKILLKEMDPKEILNLDSITVDPSGNFTLNEKVKEAGFYLLQFGAGKELVLSMEPGEKLVLSGNPGNIPESIQLSGSEGTRLLKEFYTLANRNKLKVDSLKTILRNAEGSPDFYKLSISADSAFQKINEAQKAIEKEFIDKHKEILASLIVLNFSLGSSPVLTMDEDLDYYQKLTALSVKYANNKHVIYHRQRITVFLDNKSKPKFR